MHNFKIVEKQLWNKFFFSNAWMFDLILQLFSRNFIKNQQFLNDYKKYYSLLKFLLIQVNFFCNLN